MQALPDTQVLVAADYGQIEVRIAAAASRDPDLIRIMQADPATPDGDLHAQNVTRLFGIPFEQQGEHKALRTRAKNFMFGALYGSKGYEVWEVLAKQTLRDATLAADRMPTIDEVSRGIANVRRLYPRYFDEWVPYVIHKAREEGNTSYTLYGRPRVLPDLTSPDKSAREAAKRECVNHVIQGTAADILRIATVAVAALPHGKLILSVHDELVSLVDKNFADSYAENMREAMLLGQPLKDVPLVVDVGIGENWYATHK